MGAVGWVLGAVAGAAVIGIAVAVSSKSASAQPSKTLPPPPLKIVPGHRYEFVALNAMHTPKAQLITGLEALGWLYPVIYLYGDPYTPSDIVWPPIADKTAMYAARARRGTAASSRFRKASSS